MKMATLNKVFLMGRLTRDPELRYTPQGMPVTDLGLAVNREFTPSGGGERRKDTLFIDVTVWKKQAEVICQYLKKGQPIFIEGRLQMDSWEKDGKKNTRIRVVAENFQFLSGPSSGGGGGGGGRGSSLDAPPLQAPPSQALPSQDMEESGRPPSGDYGSTYRRTAVPAESGPESGPNGDFEAPPDSDLPF
jgi:single-strand DNA-binding protein